jgi:hypothetical protein
MGAVPMSARLRLAAGMLLAVAAVMMSGCGLLAGFGGQGNTGASAPATGTPSVTATSSAMATSSVTEASFAAEPKPASSDPVLTSGSWGYHSAVDYDDSGNGTQINRTAEAKERYKLIKEQYYDLLDALRDSSGVEDLVSDAGGDTSDIKYSVVALDAEDLVGINTPWVTATLRASFPSEDGLKAVDVYVYRLKTKKGLNNTPYVSGTAVGYVDVDGSIRNPSNPNFPR